MPHQHPSEQHIEHPQQSLHHLQKQLQLQQQHHQQQRQQRRQQQHQHQHQQTNQHQRHNSPSTTTTSATTTTTNHHTNTTHRQRPRRPTLPYEQILTMHLNGQAEVYKHEEDDCDDEDDSEDDDELDQDQYYGEEVSDEDYHSYETPTTSSTTIDSGDFVLDLSLKKQHT